MGKMFIMRRNIANMLMKAALATLPECRYKTELKGVIFDLNQKIIAAVRANDPSAKKESEHTLH